MRDDFSSKTKEILGKRVGYYCSNPNCRKATIGPTSDKDKALNIGIAAHITAASEGGARYNEELSHSERKDIDNGIWLCANCATLIDRDPDFYTVEVLKEWKESDEKKALEAINFNERISENLPLLEIDMVYDTWGRFPEGISEKNFEVFGKTISAGTDYYQYWTLNWRFSLIIYNNSEVTAYNIKLLEKQGTKFTNLKKLDRINHIKPLDKLELKGNYSKKFHGTSKEADTELKNVSKDFSDKILEITYYDNKRNELKTKVTFDSGEPVSTMISGK